MGLPVFYVLSSGPAMVIILCRVVPVIYVDSHGRELNQEPMTSVVPAIAASTGSRQFTLHCGRLPSFLTAASLNWYLALLRDSIPVDPPSIREAWLELGTTDGSTLSSHWPSPSLRSASG